MSFVWRKDLAKVRAPRATKRKQLLKVEFINKNEASGLKWDINCMNTKSVGNANFFPNFVSQLRNNGKQFIKFP